MRVCHPERKSQGGHATHRFDTVRQNEQCNHSRDRRPNSRRVPGDSREPREEQLPWEEAHDNHCHASFLNRFVALGVQSFDGEAHCIARCHDVNDDEDKRIHHAFGCSFVAREAERIVIHDHQPQLKRQNEGRKSCKKNQCSVPRERCGTYRPRHFGKRICRVVAMVNQQIGHSFAPWRSQRVRAGSRNGASRKASSCRVGIQRL
mmetsp:Transcript_49202/g.151919  ORF Transcript_49202/g.151919 Transcript_49202/m.151919 type:complete len:205 (-) Transcript_49202:2590-3204(-)